MTIPEQLANHWRQEIEEGRMRGMMPGVLQLEKEARVNRKAVEATRRLIELGHRRIIAWRQPQVSHIRWDSGPLVRRIVR